MESAHFTAGYVCGPCPPGFHGDGHTCVATGEVEAEPGLNFCSETEKVVEGVKSLQRFA